MLSILVDSMISKTIKAYAKCHFIMFIRLADIDDATILAVEPVGRVREKIEPAYLNLGRAVLECAVVRDLRYVREDFADLVFVGDRVDVLPVDVVRIAPRHQILTILLRVHHREG